MPFSRKIQVPFQGELLQSAFGILPRFFFIPAVFKLFIESVETMVSRCIHEPCRGQHQVPAEDRSHVSPFEAVTVSGQGILRVHEILVAALVVAEVNAVSGADDPVDFGIEVVEGIPQGFQVARDELFQP